MNEEKKIPLDEVMKRAQAIMHYEKPEEAFRTLITGWIRHPRYKSPGKSTLNTRLRIDGFKWLKEDEIDSLSDYFGCDLR